MRAAATRPPSGRVLKFLRSTVYFLDQGIIVLVSSADRNQSAHEELTCRSQDFKVATGIERAMGRFLLEEFSRIGLMFPEDLVEVLPAEHSRNFGDAIEASSATMTRTYDLLEIAGKREVGHAARQAGIFYLDLYFQLIELDAPASVVDDIAELVSPQRASL